MNISKFRQEYVVEIRTEISRQQKSIQRDELTLHKINSFGLSAEIRKIREEELTISITEKEKTIEELQRKESDYMTGKCDAKIEEELTTAYEASRKPEKKIVAKPKKEPPKYHQKDKEEKYLQKDYDYYYKRYLYACDTLPSYMERNIQNMTNNKGYFWKGCLFLGLCAPKKNENMLFFDRHPKGVNNNLLIHEYSPTEYCLYEKPDKGNKKLLIKRRRKKK